MVPYASGCLGCPGANPSLRCRQKAKVDPTRVASRHTKAKRIDSSAASAASSIPPPSERGAARPTGRTVQTATPSTVRAFNRSIILDLIRLNQPISRARLSRLSGIFRSNVSGIVDQLIAMDWIVEKRAVAAGRGRVPILLYLNPRGFRVLGASLRADKTEVAVGGLTGEVGRRQSFSTPKHPAQLVRKLSECIRQIVREELGSSPNGFEELGMGVPGLVSAETGRILFLPTMPEYSGFNLAAELQKRIGFRVTVDNDANLVALATLWLDKTANLSDFVVLEVGEAGFGGGVVLNHKLYRGSDSSFACEIGHMVVDPNGPGCACGRHGCLQLYVCNRATWHRYDPQTEFSTSRFRELVQSAQQGDPKALSAVRETARYLSIGISNIFLILNPEMVMFAGEIAKVPDVVRLVAEQVFSATKLRVPLRTASHELENLYLYGAIHLALDRAFAKPQLGLGRAVRHSGSETTLRLSA